MLLNEIGSLVFQSLDYILPALARGQRYRPPAQPALPIINFTKFTPDSAVSYLFSNNSTLFGSIA
jgi:hypothetical protein